MIKRILFTVLVYAFLTGCSINNPTVPHQYEYCSVSHINDPLWVQQDRRDNYLISKIGVEHSRESERDIERLLRHSLAQSLSSDVHAYSQSTLDNSMRLVTNYNVNVATNVQLNNVSTEFKKVGDCLVAWASISPTDAKVALEKSHPINQKEHNAWKLIEASHNIDDYKHHLTLYPQGLYTETAKARIEVLNKHYTEQAINRSISNPAARMLVHFLQNVFY